MANFANGSSFTLKANKRYHSNFFHGPFLDQINVTLSSDPNTLITGFKAGQFDHVDGLGASDALNFTGIPQNEQIISPEDSYGVLVTNVRDAALSAAFSNDGHSLFGGTNGKLVRKAFIEAFDLCGAFATILHDTNCHDSNLYTAEGVAPPDFAYDPSVTLPAFNVQQAQADLAAAGYPGGKNKNGTQVQVTIVTSAARTLFASFATLMQQEWSANLGVKVNTEFLTAFKLFAPFSNHGILATGAYDLAIFTEFHVELQPLVAADDDDITSLIEGDQIPSATNASGINYMGLQDAKIDAYLAQGRTTLNDATRKQIYHDLFAYLASLYVLNPLFITADYSLTKPTLSNYLQQPLGQNEWNIADWWTTS